MQKKRCLAIFMVCDTCKVTALSQETIYRAQADFLVMGVRENTLSHVALSYFVSREDVFPIRSSA